ASGISERLEHEINITADPRLGYVPKARLINAAAQKLRSNQGFRSASSFTWTERGPNSDVVGPSNGNSRPGNGITSGRMRAIWEDLSDATRKTVWVGGIDGGLWKTNNITLSPAAWTPINDFFGNLSIASICQDPTNFNVMYFGTGEKAINADGVRGAGIWRSTDHGLSWSVMTGSESFWNVSKVVCDNSGNLYVGCNTTLNNAGLQRFTKASSTWTNITPSGLDPRIPDIELSSTGRLHITCGYYNTVTGSAGYRYTDNPATVTSTTWTAPAVSFSPVNINVDLASNGNTIYALPSNTSYEVSTIYKSTNGGANWSATGTTPAFTSGQGWYCMAVAVDPNNANNVIVGSLDCYKSTNGGTSWTKISNWVGTTGQYVHADQQIITWNANNQVLIGCDGGIHYSANGGTTISDRNTGLRIKQFYSVALHPTSTNYMLAGAQDNGTHQLNTAGLGSSVEVTGGDGAFVKIDQDQPQYQWGAYVYSQYRRSTNSGGSWSSINFSSSAGRFINPFDYDNVNNNLYASYSANTYFRWSAATTSSTGTSIAFPALNTGTVSAVKVSPYSSNTVYFGGGLRNSTVLPTLYKVTNAHATPTYTNIIGNITAVAATNISSIELGTTENNIIVAFSNYGINNVWVTNNGGTSWTTIDNNLPDMPVRWAMFYPGNNTKAIIATETGVWQTSLINGGLTVWDAEPGFPNVRVDMLQYRASDGLLAAATHGRGIFTAVVGALPTCGTVAGLNSSAVTTTGATVSWTALSGALNYDVDYKLTSSGTWTNAATATTGISVNLSGLTSGSIYDWRVRANCTGATGAYTQSQFTTTSSCGTVSGLISSAITTTGATVSWTALIGALNYDVDYKLTSSGTWTNAITGTTGISINLSGLTSGSIYDWRVRANCTGGAGTYAQSQFTTTSSCGTVSGLIASSITTTSATVSWTALGGALNYDVDYKLTSSGTWTNAATATAGISVNVSGLTSGSSYDWRVRAKCTGATGAYSQSQFTTIVSCGTVSGLTSSAITATGATVSWTALSGAISYDVSYKLASAGTWIVSINGTTALSRAISGLTGGSLYDWRVRANCTGASGAYVQAQFTTLSCPGTFDVSTNGSRGGAAVIPFNTNVYGLISPSGDNDYYRFNVSTTGSFTVTLTSLPANYNLSLYRNNTQVASSQNSSTTNESITYNATQTGAYYARIQANSTESNATLCYTLKVTLGTATGQDLDQPVLTNEFNLSVMPNPASNVLTILPIGLKEEGRFTITDLQGRVLRKDEIDGNKMLDISGLPAGMYMVTLREGERTANVKFVKN
ncbi:MAG: fibronectin type III domain-containing protein, partial [Saprospiraceae bacterium]